MTHVFIIRQNSWTINPRIPEESDAGLTSCVRGLAVLWVSCKIGINSLEGEQCLLSMTAVQRAAHQQSDRYTGCTLTQTSLESLSPKMAQV